jgi:hypothetical protein
MIGNLFHEGFGEEHALRATEPTEGSVGNSICLADTATDVNVWNLVNSVDVGETSLYNCARQILRVASIGIYVGVKCEEFPFFCHANLPMTKEWVALAGGDNIFIPIQHASNWSFGFCGCCGTNAC